MPPILSPISPTLPPMEMWTVWYSEWASYWWPLISSLSTQYLQLTPPWDSLSLAPVIKLSQSANLGCKDEQQFFGNNIYFTLIMCLLRMLYRWFVHPIIIWSWGGGMMSRTRSSRFSTCINISWDRHKMPATTTHYIFSDFRLDPTKFEFKTVRVWARRREVFALICYSAASWWLAVLRTMGGRGLAATISKGHIGLFLTKLAEYWYRYLGPPYILASAAGPTLEIAGILQSPFRKMPWLRDAEMQKPWQCDDQIVGN